MNRIISKSSSILFTTLTLASSLAMANTVEDFNKFLQNDPMVTAKDACAYLQANVITADQMFAEGAVNDPPKGDTAGCVIGLETLPTSVSRVVARVFNLIWTGKKFNDDGTQLVNKIPVLKPVGMGETATADVYRTNSQVDGNPIYVLDYAQSVQNMFFDSFLIRSIRDEIREVAPGVYMGPVLIEGPLGTRLNTGLYFALFTSKSGL